MSDPEPDDSSDFDASIARELEKQQVLEELLRESRSRVELMQRLKKKPSGHDDTPTKKPRLSGYRLDSNTTAPGFTSFRDLVKSDSAAVTSSTSSHSKPLPPASTTPLAGASLPNSSPIYPAPLPSADSVRTYLNAKRKPNGDCWGSAKFEPYLGGPKTTTIAKFRKGKAIDPEKLKTILENAHRLPYDGDTRESLRIDF